jgi:hypothetical protein
MLDASILKPDLNELLNQRIPYHKKYMWYSVYWVPLAATFAIVPLIPNIPLAYNLFRLYSHYKALKGAEHLKALSEYGSLQWTNDSHLDAIFETRSLVQSQDIAFPKQVEQSFKESPRKPNLVGLEQDIDGVLKLEDIKRLGETLEVPGLEMELNRARFQILKSIATERFQQEKTIKQE